MLNGKTIIQQTSKTYKWPNIDTARKHLFVLNFTDQTVTVIDTSTDTVESTITLPGTATGEGSNWLFRCMHYRPIDDFIYIYGFQKVCKIDANPNSGTFKNVYNLLGTINASNTLTIGGSYNYTDCAYNYQNDKVYLTNSSASNYAYWDFSYNNVSGLANVTADGGQNLFQGGPIFAFPPNKIVSCHAMGTAWYDENNLQSGFQLSLASANIFSGFCFIKGINGANDRFCIGTGGVGLFDATTNKRLSILMTTGGSSVYSQMIESLCYAPDYGLLFGFIKQIGTGTVYIYDILNNSFLGSFTRPNIEASAIYSGGCVYSANSKKLYLQSNGTASGVTRVHVFNPQTWINNGKVTLSDNYQGFITCGNMQDATSPTLEHRLCMNHIIPY